MIRREAINIQAFEEAIRNGDLGTVRAYLRDHPNAINARNLIGETPLTEAIKRGRTSVVEALLSFPTINVNTRNRNGYTPLMVAVLHNNLEVVRILINIPNIDFFARSTTQGNYSAYELAIRQDNDIKIEFERHMAIADTSHNAQANLFNNSLNNPVASRVEQAQAATQQQSEHQENSSASSSESASTSLEEEKEGDDWMPKDLSIRLAREAITCPVTGNLFKDPVTLSSGHTIDREMLEKLFSNLPAHIKALPSHKQNVPCPITRLPINKKELKNKSNFTIKALAEAYREQAHKHRDEAKQAHQQEQKHARATKHGLFAEKNKDKEPEHSPKGRKRRDLL